MTAAEALAAFVVNAPMPVALTDADLRILKVSPAWLTEFRVAAADMVGVSCFDLAPESREIFLDLQARCLAGETARGAPQLITTRDGAQRWMRWTCGPWLDAHGDIGGVLVMARDVTAQQQADEEAARNRAFLTTILDNVPTPMVVKDEDGRILILNRAMQHLYGDDYLDRIGKTVSELMPGDMARQIEAEDRLAMQSPEPVIEESDNITPRGDRRFIRKIKAAIHDNAGANYLLTITQDLTDRKMAQDALEGALARAEAANVSKSEFLANMSHEIRTPLNGVLGLADALSRMELTPQQREIVDMIVSSGQALTEILSDVLDLAKAEAGQLQLQNQPMSLRETIGATAFLFETVARAKGVGFEVSFDEGGPDRVVGDPLRIRQIVSNLISNAVKFTSRGAVSIHTAAVADAEGAGLVEVTVKDTGPGFSEEVRAKLFSRFEQGDGSVTRRFGGTGLGLSIAGALANMMDGEISCSAVEGEGATFVFRVRLALDVSTPAAQAPAAPEPHVEADRVMRVLLAEDHEINQKVIQLMLGAHAELVITADGAEAVDAFVNCGPFDVVLMDTQMPVMDGLTATRRLREEEAQRGWPRTPIISLTANAMAHQVTACLEAGADLHLAKPITFERLYGAINEALGPEPEEAATLVA